MKRTLYMETTEVPATKTAAELTELLVRSGATQIALDYRDQRIVGMRFAYPVRGQVVPFSMPVRVEPVFRLLKERRPEETWKRGNRTQMAGKDREQAERVAWRQLLRWVQAQIAMVETGMVETLEVFLPYVAGCDGRTMFEAFVDSGMKLLAAPEGQ